MGDRDDYGEPDGPPPRVDLALLALAALGVAVVAACVLWKVLAPNYPLAAR
jgi:hypothetical protein